MTLSVGLVPCGLGWNQAVSQDTDNTVSVVFFKDLEEDNVPLNVEPLTYALEWLDNQNLLFTDVYSKGHIVNYNENLYNTLLII